MKLIYIRLIWEKKNVFFPQERWKEANLEKHAFLDYFMAFGSGKYQCPGRSVRQLGRIYPQSLQKDDGSERKSFGFAFLCYQAAGKARVTHFVWLAGRVVRCLCENV